MSERTAGGYAGPNYTQTPNRFLDEQLAGIETLAELKVTLAVFRRTFGWGERSDSISITELERATGLGRAAVVDGTRRALARGTIARKRAGASFRYSVDVWFADRTSGSSLREPVASSRSEPLLKNQERNRSASASCDTSGRRGAQPNRSGSTSGRRVDEDLKRKLCGEQ